MNTRDKIAALRSLMSSSGISAYYIPSSDPHQSEYVPTCWQRRQWISGFTGSAGDVLVGLTWAGLWTDGRYFLQAEAELADSGIELFRAGEPGIPSIDSFLAQTLREGESVGFDPMVVSQARVLGLEHALHGTGVHLKPLVTNLIDALWQDRPSPSIQPARGLSVEFAGESMAEKLERIRQILAARSAQALVMSTLDSIAWTFNLRGADIPYNPVIIAYAIVEPEEAILFITPEKIPKALAEELHPRVTITPYEDIDKALTGLGEKQARVWIDPATLNRWAIGRLSGATLIEAPNPVDSMKAKKNTVQLQGMRNAHERDGVAMVRFLHWLEGAVEEGGVSEISAADKLEALRREGDHFRGLSFPTISSYAAHGAIIHYSVTEDSNILLRPGGLYLLDSGAQYLDGTTDVTRTVALGTQATEVQKDRFTRVLKGHIALATARFPAGTPGSRLDSFARRALWDAGLDYGHGTGHGVGAYLNVHEGPQSISHGRGFAFPLEVGNVQSNEPGYYEPGQFGIRLENLLEVVHDEELSRPGRDFLRFATLTLVPIDKRLIELSLLDGRERQWLNQYHQRVLQTLSGYLEKAEQAWLREVTRAL